MMTKNRAKWRRFIGSSYGPCWVPAHYSEGPPLPKSAISFSVRVRVLGLGLGLGVRIAYVQNSGLWNNGLSE